MPGPTQRDYYEILGLPRTASADEIKSAYRKAALRWHPDRNPQHKAHAGERFREATEAYGILSDPQKRSAYDHHGHAGVSGQFIPGFDDAAFDDFRDIIGSFFGFGDMFGESRSRRRNRPHRGADLRYDMSLTFEEAASGIQTKIKVPRLDVCDVCGGSGARAGSSPTPCKTCSGYGQIRYQQGFLAVSRTCPACQGVGRVISDPCKKCEGDGRVPREHTIAVRVPPGVDSQTRLRLSGEGEPGWNGGQPGDLHIVLEVAEHPFFERRNADLYCTIPVSIVQAALGAEIQVPTLNGPTTLKIPEGAQTGSIFRLRGKGLPDPSGGSKGDLYVSLRVVTPTKLTREQRRLLEQLDEILQEDNRPATRNSSFFSKVKDIFG